MVLSGDFRHTQNNQTFSLRASALIIKNNQILLTKDDRECYYTIGGASLIGEKTIDTVSRETFEEIGAEIEVGELAFVIENHFCSGQQFWHNIEFHYFVKLLSEPRLEMVENGRLQACEWVDLDQLTKINLVPECLQTGILNWPGHLVHIVNK
ncbi:NUDIX domain-containing protein [Streptococcus iniae]|uniref:NUDIX domain-containing protein n=1 Tax=Streptococcus iniae TaxID=1346 RepID=A0A3L8GBT2_STRIN|nr:NUDIX domain-containing protein [Streptococcus iniae]AGM99928.1 mutT/nudix family protein [Streptococcus iniae SF1]AHY16769.1 phosphohydrolase [Streptococcus iniae]AHY18634.1 phosphohydrolase [Streptococcus iniae]AJG26896.1 phosphohydrolase [Streptococcus iniae]APD32794.1 phosphohydrolase [Streptococcus iniae]